LIHDFEWISSFFFCNINIDNRQLMSNYVINPFTNKKIVVGGKTHELVQKIQAGPGSFEDKRQEYLKATHSTKKLKYANVPEQYFCGEAGGYPPGSHAFPVDSEKRCRAALSYAHNAPNPQGIRDCALKIAAEKGWNCGKYSKAKGKPLSGSAKNTVPNPSGKKTKGGHGGVPQPKKLTGYQLFIKKTLPTMKEHGITGKAALSATAQAWKNLDQSTKNYYNEEAKKSSLI